MKTPEMMTINDLRKYIRTSHSKARALVESGKIPGNQVNERGDWRVLKEDVDEFISNNKKPARGCKIPPDFIDDECVQLAKRLMKLPLEKRQIIKIIIEWGETQ